MIGLFQPVMREDRHTLYQFTEPWVVDDSAGSAPRSARRRTPLDDALATTLAWYRDQAAVLSR